jgi:hypothetical protein
VPQRPRAPETNAGADPAIRVPIVRNSLYRGAMDLTFTGEVWYWRGPSPYHFVRVPDEHCEQLHDVAPDVSYGWGMIPVRVRIGATRWETSLFPKDGAYLVPVKDVVRRAEGIDTGDTVTVGLSVAVRRRLHA